MKSVFALCSPRVAAVLLTFAIGVTSEVRAGATQATPEAKMQLMADALHARAQGDLLTARGALEQLVRLGDRDPAVARLLAEVNAQLAANATSVEPLAIKVAVDQAPVQGDDGETLMQAETQRLKRAIATARTARGQAAESFAQGNYLAAVTTLDAALASLPVNPLTQDLVGELRRARDEAAAAAAQPVPAPVAADDPRHDEAVALAARGRAQYLAGESSTAAVTLHAALERDPNNAEARQLLARIARDREGSVRNRETSRAQLLDEVNKSWRRPEVFQERTRGTAAAESLAPVMQKLNAIVLPNVNFTRVELGRVLNALSAASEEFDPAAGPMKGVNIVLLDPSNKNPLISLSLRNTTLKRVLDFATEAAGYQYEVQSDAVVVRPGGETSTLDTAIFPVTRATVLRMSGVASVNTPDASATTKPADPLSSAGANNEAAGGEAVAMKAFLQQAGVNFEETKGSSLAYDGSAMIVTQTPRNIERIRNILARYNDVRQVEIEAKFMEVQEGALDELGVQWNVSRRGLPQFDTTTGAPILNSSGQQVTVPQEVYSTSGVNRTLPFAFPSQQSSNGGITINSQQITTNAPPNIPGSVSLASGAAALASITGMIGEFDVNAVVRALAQKQGTDLLSAPKVTVLSGSVANITVAQELRYPTSFGQTQSQVGTGSASGGGSAGVAITAGTPQNFEKRNVGVELKVTPTVEEDDYSISLDLNPKVTEFDGFVEYGGPSVAISQGNTVTVPSGFYQPIFSVRDISTKVTIWDGATLIMGGLTREEVKKVNDKVPLLGDLPLLGRLFKSKGESAQKRNLLIFVTANLVSPGGSLKKQELRDVAPSALFQNPSVVTPQGADPRVNGTK
ncbi:type II secretory pathway, component PulD [Horticoccus luteus]|uniref:Type II secretory pathway, component PulD n=1 Tax=Horticoccus luteus TaxID=2862869 RepID=A0A8F9TY58_9BACT|nr:type II secretory pathway, component PulD [Horticoccus luteus]QYM80014.1 type II secretory pathway, component PulD [Horticoccus luteus]